MEELGFVIACRKFFGQQKDQSLGEFQAEVKKLTEQDRKDLTPRLEVALGCKIRA